MDLSNRYQPVAKLDSGGMAEVFLGVQMGQQILERLVVIKKLHTFTDKSSEMARMFLDEAKIIASLNHPHIVQIFDLTQTDDHFNIVMEYIDGESLSYVLKTLRKENRSVPIPIACRLMEQVCEALQYAHTIRTPLGEPLNFVHRDIDPRNLMINSNGYLKVIDFGVAKASVQTEMTAPGLFKGKLTHLAPDVFTCKDIDHRVDIYSSGLVLFEMTTMQKPFHFPSNEPVMVSIRRIVEEPLADPCSIRANLPRRLADIVLKACNKNRDQRYRSAEELSADIRSFVRSIGGMATNAEVRRWFTSQFTDRLAQRRQFETQVLQLARKKTSRAPLQSTSNMPSYNSHPEAYQAYNNAAEINAAEINAAEINAAGITRPSHPGSSSRGKSPASFVVNEALDLSMIQGADRNISLPPGNPTADNFAGVGMLIDRHGIASNKKMIAAAVIGASVAAILLVAVIAITKQSPDAETPAPNLPVRKASASAGGQTDTTSLPGNAGQKTVSGNDNAIADSPAAAPRTHDNESDINKEDDLFLKRSARQVKRKPDRRIAEHSNGEHSSPEDIADPYSSLSSGNEKTAAALSGNTSAADVSAAAPVSLSAAGPASQPAETGSALSIDKQNSTPKAAVKAAAPANPPNQRSEKPQWLSGNGNWSGAKVASSGCTHCHQNISTNSKTTSQWEYFFSHNRHRRYKDLSNYFSPMEISRVQSHMISKSKADESNDTAKGIAGVR